MIATFLIAAGAFSFSEPNLLQGRSVQIDPSFAYYQQRSADSIAREIEVNGYKVVRYVVTNDEAIRDDIIRAFHKRGMLVWYLTFGNGFYGSKPKSIPDDWKEWKAQFIGNDTHTGYTFLSLSHQGYRDWKAEQIVGVLSKHAFDGVEIAEPFQMGWGGPEAGLYGDFSPAAISRFQEQHGYPEPPDFRNPADPKWYKTDTKRYEAWCDFRVSEVNSFLKHIREAVKAKMPAKPFSVWMLANSSPIAGTSPKKLMREWQGIDAEAMAKTVRPDLVCFQTNWPDWSNPSLSGDYVNLYLPFISPFRQAFPSLPVIVQADTGSLKPMRRSRSWIELFESTCKKLGVGSTYYMYDISLWQYTEPPKLISYEAKKDQLILCFQKRIDPKIEQQLDRIKVSPTCRVARARCDGNLLYLWLKGMKKGTSYQMTIKQLGDDFKKRLYDDFPQQKADITARFRT